MDLETVNKLIEEIKEDRTVPRNIRTLIEEAQKDLHDETHDLVTRIGAAISILDEVSNDVNNPPYTRTQIWNIVSILETIKEQSKSWIKAKRIT